MKSHLVFGLVGLVVGVSFAENLWGAISGACLGVLFSNWNSSRVQLGALRESIAALEAQQAGISRLPIDESTSSAPDEEISPTAPPITTPEPTPTTSREPDIGPSLEDAVAAAFSSRANRTESFDSAADPSRFERMTGTLRSFFLGGNTIVRIGLLVLWVGLTLLAKYAADNSLFPVEARLGSAALVGLGLVALAI